MTAGQRYLLIDDNSTFARLMQRGFARRHLQLDWAGDQAQALTFEADYTGIILDLNLAGDSGLQLLPDLLQHYSDSRIVILTGYASVHTAVRAIKLGAVNYLPKPATADAILQAFDGQAPAQQAQADFERPSPWRVSWEHIQYCLDANDGNISATARELNMHRRTLQRILKKHALQK